MHIKKAYTFRLETDLIKQLDTFDNTRTYNLTTAIQKYIQQGFTESYNYNTEIIQVLKDQVQDLRQDKNHLQNQVDALIITRIPLLQRIITKIKTQ